MYISRCQCCGDSLTPYERQKANSEGMPAICDYCEKAGEMPEEPREEIYNFSDADPGL
jgi:hypothetical protein